jgi:hypothetical protein
MSAEAAAPRAEAATPPDATKTLRLCLARAAAAFASCEGPMVALNYAHTTIEIARKLHTGDEVVDVEFPALSFVCRHASRGPPTTVDCKSPKMPASMMGAHMLLLHAETRSAPLRVCVHLFGLRGEGARSRGLALKLKNLQSGAYDVLLALFDAEVYREERRKNEQWPSSPGLAKDTVLEDVLPELAAPVDATVFRASDGDRAPVIALFWLSDK